VGMVTAIGGGMLRDVLLNRVSLVLQQEELYATVAFLTASLAVCGHYLGWSTFWSAWLPIVAGFVFRWVSLRRKWVLPTFNRKDQPGIDEGERIDSGPQARSQILAGQRKGCQA